MLRFSSLLKAVGLSIALAVICQHFVYAMAARNQEVLSNEGSVRSAYLLPFGLKSELSRHESLKPTITIHAEVENKNSKTVLSVDGAALKDSQEPYYTFVYLREDQSLGATPVKRMPSARGIQKPSLNLMLPRTGTSEEEIPEPKVFVPQCEPSLLANAWPILSLLSEDDLEALVRIRQQKKKLYQQQIKELLGEQNLAELYAIEERHGLRSGADISAELSPRDLVRRLGLIDGLRLHP